MDDAAQMNYEPSVMSVVLEKMAICHFWLRRAWRNLCAKVNVLDGVISMQHILQLAIETKLERGAATEHDRRIRDYSGRPKISVLELALNFSQSKARFLNILGSS